MILVVFAFLVLLSQAAERLHKDCPQGLKCSPYYVISSYPSYELREYEESKIITLTAEYLSVLAKWLSWREHFGVTSVNDFPFLVDYADRRMAKYFEGDNYAGETLSRTTPMKVDVRLFDLNVPRTVSVPVGVENGDVIPAPMYPFFITKVKRSHFYVREVDPELNYIEMLREIAKFMTDLSIDLSHFDHEVASIVLYNQPKVEDTEEESEIGSLDTTLTEESKEEGTLKTEIWIARGIFSEAPRRDDRSAYTGEYGQGGGFGGGRGYAEGGGHYSGGFSGRDHDWNGNIADRGVGNGGNGYGSREFFRTTVEDLNIPKRSKKFFTSPE